MIRFLLNITKGYRLRIVLIVLLGLLNVFASLAFVWYSKKTIDLAVGTEKGDLVTFCSILVGLIVFQIVMRLVTIKLTTMTSVKLTNSIRTKIFSDLLYIRWQELSSLHSGDVLTRVIKDTGDLVSLIIDVLPTMINASIQFIGAFAMLMYMDQSLALILGILMPILVFFSRVFFKRMRALTRDVKESESNISKHLQESQQSQLVIRAFERQTEEIERLDELQYELEEKVRKRTKSSLFTSAIMNIAFRGGYLVAFIRSVYLLSSGSITFGSLTAYLQLVGRLQMPLNSIVGVLSTLISASASVDRLRFITEFEKEKIYSKHFLEAPLQLSIRNLSFTYKGDQIPVLSDFSMEAHSGEMIALVGESGAGKTTFLKLLLGLVEPSTGVIEIQNTHKKISVSEQTRSNFVYVPQGASLFNGTVRQNLLVGDSDATEDQLKLVLEMASADFVYELPNGVNTMLGERGSRLSEGQSQRIAIARALLRPGKVLLLDEATSALDLKTGAKFVSKLKESIGDRIIIFITHQKEVAEYCDKVVSIQR